MPDKNPQPSNAEIMAKIEELSRDHKSFADDVREALQGNIKERTPGLIAEVAENKRKLAIVTKCAWTAASTSITTLVGAIIVWVIAWIKSQTGVGH